MDFQQTLSQHLDAIQQRNLESFLATLAEDGVTVILPNGTLVQGFDAVAELHRAWFADQDWTMDVLTLSSHETAEMALALLLVEYRDLDPTGQPYSKRYYLTLTFTRIKGQWRLIHDQNTWTQ